MKHIQWPYIPTLFQCLSIRSNGTVTDRKTGLMWPRCELGKTWEKRTNTGAGEATTDSWREQLETALATFGRSTCLQAYHLTTSR